MTKADIVNEIAKTTGIDKANVVETIEKFMDIVKDSLAHGENSIPPWLRQLHHQGALGEDRTQHLQEYHHHHPRAQDTGIQTGKGVHGRSKVVPTVRQTPNFQEIYQPYR